MKTDLFEYGLPEELIAAFPPSERDGGRMLVLDNGEIAHRWVRELPGLLSKNALVVVNDTRVRRARVLGTRSHGGGRVEVFFLSACGTEDGAELWQALGRANNPLRPGTQVEAGDLVAEVRERLPDGVLVLSVRAPGGVETWLERHGHVPIPPYLRRSDEPSDGERYQTVYARRTLSTAAPTAGLHLTPQMFAVMEASGVEIGRLELEIGLGTFRPVETPDLDEHPMHAERFTVAEELAKSVARAREEGRKVIAVGTTVVRALESAADPERPGLVIAGSRETRLLIQPGFQFRVVDGLLTNFHQPRSTLLALVAAFAGFEATRRAYAAAIAARYRFLSYGDAMWIPRRA